ncbi:hypothetical protein LOTGIDRAFT_190164 [Lottia gigantea]|uniref:Protein kinase domain-containing protein n=1 Tax=Lottia gigantea TaxID=225164 RepID=V4BVR1_LOTGI|nr:hypothetical protein LOTGIDRAFT_190164 [Lottia gigantea]ESO93119.1 hypothetical protein LOTGIDRAFT_190164 [Lottia gigantea]
MGAGESKEIRGYTIDEKLGSGCFGEVFKCNKDGKTYAIKKMVVNDSATIKEVRSHMGLSHINVVKYIDSFSDEGYLWIVLEYCSGGNLNDYVLRQNPNSSELIRCIRQVLYGVEYLHSNRVLHRDIKPDNVMMQGNTLKLADFGLARIWSLSNDSEYYDLKGQKGLGPPYYTAPEVQLGNITKAVDIFSVGCMIIAMFSRTTISWAGGKQLLAPYINNPNNQITDASEQAKKNYVGKLNGLTGGQKDMVVKMVEDKWRNRPSATAAKASF